MQLWCSSTTGESAEGEPLLSSSGGLSKDEFFGFGLIVAPIVSALIGLSVTTVYQAHNLDGSRGTFESEAERLYGLVISEDVGDELRYYDDRSEYLQESDLEEGFAPSEVHRFGTAELLVNGKQQIVQLVWKGEWMLAEASVDGATITELPTVPAQP